MPTIKDIARLTGVSVTQVSRALNNYNDVSQFTKDLVLKTAKEIGYIPNRSAQNLVMKRNNTLAIILSGLEKDGGKDNIVYRILSGMYQYAEEINYEVILYTTSSAHQKEKSYTQFCRENNIGGAVLNGLRTDDPYFEELLESDIPCVLIDNYLEGNKNVGTISVDNVKGAYDIVSHLILNNHKNIAMINGRSQATVSSDRLKGYLRALTENNLEINEEWIVNSDFLEHKAYEVTRDLLNKEPRITALFCASDMIALGALRAIKELGKVVPKDISIVGYDDIPIARYIEPSLTTVAQDFYEMGYRAAEKLHQIIQNKPVEKISILDHKVLVRESVSML